MKFRTPWKGSRQPLGISEGIRKKMKHIFINSSPSQGRGQKFNFWELFSPKFETKYFIFDETYMFRIKTEHISERGVLRRKQD